MEELIGQMKVCLASVFSLYLKTQSYHWNVEGQNFAEYHKFLGDLYEEIYGSIDQIAEEIRVLGAYAPGSLKRFSELSVVEDEINVRTPTEMMNILFVDNAKVIEELISAYKLAESENQYGTSNFIQDRITAHKKHEWMLRSFNS